LSETWRLAAITSIDVAGCFMLMGKVETRNFR